MFASFDWMHGVALALGAVATMIFPKKASSSTSPSPPPASPNDPAKHPLFDALVRILEGKLTDLIHVEPGPDGEPMFTVRVVLVNEQAKG